jgi:transposase
MPSKESRRDQTFLLPVSVDQWVAPDHPVRFIWDFVEALDLEELGIRSLPCDLGRPSYPAKELLACWLYGFMVRTRTSRALERACRESLPFIWLAGLLQPDHLTFWRFLKANREAMHGLFKKTVQVAITIGMVDLALQAIDGTKVSVSSNHRLRQKKHLQKLLIQVGKEIAEMEEQEAQDMPAEDRGKQKRARAHKENQRVRVQRALAQVEAAEQDEGRESDAKPVALVSDPEARLMKTRHGWKPAYNAQVLVDSREQIIVVADVTQDNYDCDQLLSLLAQEKEELECCAQVTVADNGYYSTGNLEDAANYTDLYVPDKTFDTKLRKNPEFHFSKFSYLPEDDVYVCPQGKRLLFLRHTKIKGREVRGREYQCRECAGCPVRKQCTRSKVGRIITWTPDLALQQAHREKMGTATAREIVRRRAPLVEAVFGILKEQQGARRFLMRSLAKVKQEWYLLCTAFNLRKLYRGWLRKLTAAV